MRSLILLACGAVVVCAQTAAPPKPAKPVDGPKTTASKATPRLDPLQKAMSEEMARSGRLKVLDPLYYIEYGVDEASLFSTSATLGAEIRQTHNRIRVLRTVVRVGSMKSDNTNSIYSDYYSGVRYDSDLLPLDDAIYPLRHALWLSTDRAYKAASEALARKTAALRGVTVTDPLPDFSAAPANIVIDDTKFQRVDEAAWSARTKALSGIYRNYGAVTSSAVDYQAAMGAYYYMNSEGSLVRIPDGLQVLQTRASMQAADGSPLYDGMSIQTIDRGQLPSEAALRHAVEDVGKNLTALAAAPAGESYIGPVLFEPRAAGQIFAEIFGAALSVTRRPVAPPTQSIPYAAAEFEGRLGARVLPDWMSVTDDPTRKEWNGRQLLGFYQVDLEGQVPKPLTIVDKGILKAFVSTRTPVRGASESNGRARLPGGLGARAARFSNLFVASTEASPMADLKKRMLELVKLQNKPYGILVRKMDFPSAATSDDLRRLAVRTSRSSSGARPVSSPVLIYRVYPDGKEELIRRVRFRGLSSRSFRDILAVSTEQALFDYLENGAPFALMGAGSFVVGCAVVSPGLLFEELEMEQPEEELPKLPLSPVPSLSGS